MAKWYESDGFQNDIVLSTRVRLARNIKGIPFPNKMRKGDAEKVINLVSGTLKNINYDFTLIRMDEISDLEKQRLLEAHYISPDMLSSPEGKAIFISKDENVIILINEEDHIRLQSIYAGFESEKAYDIIDKIDTCLSNSIDLAFHEKYGYLTSCLTNTGTGMRLSFMMHLPAICKSNIADSLFATIGKLGVTVRGVYGEGTQSSGYMFQISNQITMGKTEKEIIDSLNDVIQRIISKEREIRTTMVKRNGIALEDKIMRSCGILKYAKVISSKEMSELLSTVRFGISIGIIKDISIKDVNSILIESRPAHIMQGKELTTLERDVKRAEYVNNKLRR